jgi:cysteine synthase A
LDENADVGIGQGRVTENLKPDIDLVDNALHVPDERSIEMVYRLLDEEGYFILIPMTDS